MFPLHLNLNHPLHLKFNSYYCLSSTLLLFERLETESSFFLNEPYRYLNWISFFPVSPNRFLF